MARDARVGQRLDQLGGFAEIRPAVAEVGPEADISRTTHLGIGQTRRDRPRGDKDSQLPDFSAVLNGFVAGSQLRPRAPAHIRK
jgi:hypothetical protein